MPASRKRYSLLGAVTPPPHVRTWATRSLAEFSCGFDQFTGVRRLNLPITEEQLQRTSAIGSSRRITTQANRKRGVLPSDQDSRNNDRRSRTTTRTWCHGPGA